MWISRMRVTGGFLADLDVTFSPGLNVVIGARGAGKTSLLELLRHALGVQHADGSRAAQQQRFINAMLGPGEVIIDLETGTESQRLVVDAAGGGRRAEFADVALVLGQNELESIASDAANRLALIDLRAQILSRAYPTQEAQALTSALALRRAQIIDAQEHTAQRALLAQDMEALRLQEAQLLSQASIDLTDQRDHLRQLEDALLRAQQEGRRAVEASHEASQLLDILGNLRSGIDRLDGRGLPLSGAQDLIASISSYLSAASDRLNELLAGLGGSATAANSRELELRGQAEPIRSNLESVERGLGEVTARLRGLQGQLVALDSADEDSARVRNEYSRLLARRETVLDEAEAAVESIYEARERVASDVSAVLDEHVIVSVEHLADAEPFKEFLIRRLQGSQLKYQALADALARTVLPRQLLRQIERRAVDELAATAKIPVERAARLIDHLQEAEVLGELAGVHLVDRVDFLLRDGATTKRVEELSTGQKCAVTLPILMTELSRTLVMDQPEDHLDNAYLVSNIVQGLLRRGEVPAQTIVASHNANIPVLGSAEKVLVLASDGTRGFVRSTGPFDSPDVVDAITKLMEGGREAFAQRANFYATHGS